MSLNHTEQKLFDYVLGHTEERQHWQAKVRQATKDKATADRNRTIAAVLADELWQYYLERSNVVPGLTEAHPHERAQRISMQNLAEHLVRTWGPGRSARGVKGSVEALHDGVE